MCSRIEQNQEADGSFTTHKITELVDGGVKRVLHSVDGRPAVIRPNGNEYWYKDGILLKMCDKDNNQGWYNSRGHYHRAKGLPAVVMANGTRQWYKNGLLHRDGDKPAVECEDGTRKWYINGLVHRDGDKPAIEWANGIREWCSKGALHRGGDEPAVVRADGKREWWVNGKRVDKSNTERCPQSKPGYCIIS